MTQRRGGDDRRRGWRPHLSRAATWLVATVLAAVIGVVVSELLTDWLPGSGKESDDRPQTTTRTQLPFPDSRLVSAEKVGLYQVELDGGLAGAQRALGPPRMRESSGRKCTMTFDHGVTMEFIYLGAGDPCVDGRFCSANVSGRDWATTRGLQVGESVRRLFELYPKAPRIPRPGALTRYLLERGTAPCGDAAGGLEAWASSGRIAALHVTFRALGD